MEIIIFDVDDAACALICSPNGYGMMIDCGCAAKNSDKENPIEVIKNVGEWLTLKPYITQMGKSYPLALLHITHPDDDHVRNTKRIVSEFVPYLLNRTYTEEYPDAASINDDYKQFIDTTYRGSNPERIEWGFQEDKQFRIPIEIIKTNELLNSKIRNNSSIIRYLKYGNISILFAGDLEYNGWNWLAQNNNDFVQTVKEGIDILIAPHHGHKSGFPKSLFDLCGSVRVVIHSKGSEGNIEGTNVSTQYNVYTTGIEYQTLNNKLFYSANILTTRSNGTIYFKINSDGTLKFWTTKASCNHKQIK